MLLAVQPYLHFLEINIMPVYESLQPLVYEIPLFIIQLTQLNLFILAVEYKIEETEHPNFIQGRVGKIIINNKELGILGEVAPLLLKSFELKMAAVALEMDIENI